MNEEAIKEGLNFTGVYLQRNIFNSLRIHGFGARREEPYFKRSQFGEIIEGTADIFSAIQVSENRILSLIVECKRANPQQKHWVFETRDNEEELPYPFVYYIPGKGVNYSYNIFFPTLGYHGMKHFDQAIQAFEFKDVGGKPKPNSQDIALSKDANQNTYRSLKQAQDALSSLYSTYAAEDLAMNINRESLRKMDVAQKIHKIVRPMERLYIPIVVTTANLWVMDYNPQEIDRKSGTIPSYKITLKPKKWVHYEFPLPDSLRIEGDSIDGKLIPAKSPVIVINSQAFDYFINGIKEDTKSYVLKLE